jgi:hypothetical protein
MKNIHILPTDKPSRLGKFIDTNNLFLRTSNDIPRGENVYIYITSDEEIKEGDWILNPTNEVQNCIGLEKGIGTDNICWVKVKETTTLQQILNSQKIILTTDQDLIKDGVQTIDDEFLEWFIKNPSCKSVEIKLIPTRPHSSSGKEFGAEEFLKANCTYKIIIPKEEREQETLEEAAKNYADNGNWEMFEEDTHIIRTDAFINGAKWQAERMYSEEEVEKYLDYYEISIPRTIKQFFKQFKKA